MSILSKSAPVVLIIAAFPVWSAACGGTSGAGKEPAAEIGPNTPYYVMPVQAADNSLPPAVNDYGPHPLSADDCADPADMEFALVDDYEGGVASKTYTYNDSTCEVMPTALKDWEPASTAIPQNWITYDANNVAQPGKRCGSTRAMHLAGTYTNWGAGLGTVLDNHETTLNPDVNNPQVPFTPLTVEFAAQGDTPYIPAMASADVSQWEGITFWARRGPYGEDGFRPGILDRTTSDDFNKQLTAEHAACRSIYTICSCTNGKPCTEYDPDPTNTQYNHPDPATIPLSGCYSGFVANAADKKGTYCWDPKVDAWPSDDPSIRCGQTACDFRTDTPIPSMIYNPVNATEANLWQVPGPSGAPGVGTMHCSDKPYVFQDTREASAQFCYTPGVDLDPPEKLDRCGDSWLGSPAIDTDWKRYYIPFADMRQGNVDKRSPGLDVCSIEALVFAFPGGNLDVWIDDPQFYRHKGYVGPTCSAPSPYSGLPTLFP